MKFSAHLFLFLCITTFGQDLLAQTVTCAYKIPPVGGDDSIGSATYLDFIKRQGGNYRLLFVNGCNYSWSKEKCFATNYVTDWTSLNCSSSDEGGIITWTCSNRTEKNCLIARYRKSSTKPDFLANSFQFVSFNECSLEERVDDPLHFHAAASNYRCKLQ